MAVLARNFVSCAMGKILDWHVNNYTHRRCLYVSSTPTLAPSQRASLQGSTESAPKSPNLHRRAAERTQGVHHRAHRIDIPDDDDSFTRDASL